MTYFVDIWDFQDLQYAKNTRNKNYFEKRKWIAIFMQEKSGSLNADKWESRGKRRPMSNTFLFKAIFTIYLNI